MAAKFEGDNSIILEEPMAHSRGVLSSLFFCSQPHDIACSPKCGRLSSKILPLLFACVLLGLSFAQAQTGPAPTLADELGFIPYQSYHGGDVDSVNLSNGRVMIHAPLMSYPQRGGLLKEGFSLRNGSNALQVQQFCTPPPDVSCVYNWNVGSMKSQLGAVSAAVGVVDEQNPSAGVVQVKGNILPNGYQNYYYYGRLFTGDGASHLVGQTSGVWQTTNTSLTNATFRSIDGTGYSFGVDASGNWTILDSSGIKYGGASWKEDPNGNEITFSASTNTITDTMGRNIPWMTNTTASDSTSCPQGGTLLPISSATVWSLPGLNGGTFQIKFCYALVTVNIPTLTINDNFVYGYPLNPHGISALQRSHRDVPCRSHSLYV